MNSAARPAPIVPKPYQAQLPRILQYLYFPWRWLVFAPFTVLNTLVCASLALLVALVSEDAAYQMTRLWARLQCLANLTRLRTRGLEHVSAGQGYVVMTNHQSNFDFALIAGLPMPLRFAIKGEYRTIPFFAWACTAAGAIWLDRGDRQRAIASLDAAKPKVERGISLQLFPEGTRSRDGAVGPFKKGGFMVALPLGVPILPVTISGSGRVWPPGTLRILPGRIDYQIHEAIDVRAYGEGHREELMAAVRAALEAGLVQSENKFRDSAPQPGTAESR